MTDLKQRFIRWLLFVFVLNSFFACAGKKPTVILDAEAEIWEFQFKGEAIGTVKMTLKRKEIEKDHYLIQGKITGQIQDHRAGPGDADYSFEGKIEKDYFRASFSGPSYMAAGSAIIHGKMNGIIFKDNGTGTWSVMHPMGISTGKYFMRKRD